MDTENISTLLAPLAAIIAAFITGGILYMRKGNKPNWAGPIFSLLLVLFFICVALILFSSVFPGCSSGFTTPTETPAVIESEESTISKPAVPDEHNQPAEPIFIGSIYKFGSYEQDGKEGNGVEPIEWIVLDKKDNNILLLSVLGLDARPFADGQKTSTWADSSIIDWLNGKFYLTAFTDEERQQILETEVIQNTVSQYPRCDQGENTISYVFLLSSEEYNEYMYNGNIDPEYRNGTPSIYLADSGLDLMNDTYCWWWLRTSSQKNETAYAVSSYGVLDPVSHKVHVDGGMIRPAIWIDISA